jgi:S4 domain protein YaaA
MRKIAISTEYITLGQLLKLAGCVDTGGEVKLFLRERRVTVNGQREERRGRKLYPGDMVEAEGFGRFTVERR